MTFSLSNIIPIIEAKQIGDFSDFKPENVSIDSRSMQNNQGTLFFALGGQNHDAHNYIENLIARGVQHFVVEKIPENSRNKAVFLVVKNTRTALQQTAKYYRSLFSFSIIGITGSKGKTTVKEWLNFLLSPHFSIVRSPKSYNSQVGVPLSVFGINEHHDLGIFEAGISQKGEMDVLQAIIRPQIGVFTHFGQAHSESFANDTEKISEKALLFKECETVILEKNSPITKFLKSQLFTFSLTDISADVYAEIKAQKNGISTLEITFRNENFAVSVPFADTVFLYNAVLCIAVLLYLNINPKHIVERSAHLYPVEIRLQTKKGINNCVVIDDLYSSDYQSIKIALDFFQQQKRNTKSTVILSDVFQSGLPAVELYEKVSRILHHNKINRIIAIGETISKHLAELPNVFAYASTSEFLQQFNTQSFQNEDILIKGARNFNFDEIAVLLEEKKHETILEINLDALTHNLNFYKSLLNPETKVMVMVKAFGYGNGGYEIAKLLEHHKIDYLGVAFADEGIELRKAGITIPIVVLNPEISSFSAMIAYTLEPEIYSIKGLREFIAVAQQKNTASYPIHIKADTGMHRLGFDFSQLDELTALLNQTNVVTIASVFSHLAASDDMHFSEFTQKQYRDFSEFCIKLQQAVGYKTIRHLLNTSGIFNYPEMQFEMVRLGIGLYGFGNSEAEKQKLENVSTLKSIISQIRTINKGESVSYSRKFTAQKTTTTATIPIGYADGIKRAWGNEKGYVLINGQKAVILGTICMDMLMAEVTDIVCKEGDEVIIFGENPSVEEIAKATSTITYEVITGISQRVKRIFFKN